MAFVERGSKPLILGTQRVQFEDVGGIHEIWYLKSYASLREMPFLF